MKLVVDLTRCQGYAQCAFLAPSAFSMRGDEALLYDPDPSDELRERVLRAAAACPVQAIVLDPVGSGNGARQAEAARQAAGLSRTTSSLNIALKAMNENAQRDLASADAAAAKAKLLTPTVPEKDDPNIAAAMAAASGQGAPPVGVANRLAALKAKLG